MPKTTSVNIKKVPIRHTKSLNKLFNYALISDFGYFNNSYLETVSRANRPLKLATAIIHPSRLVLGVYNSSGLVGYSISTIQPNQTAYLFWLYINPNLRGEGIGKQLLNDTESHLLAKKVTLLELVTHNQAEFYLRQGFEKNQVLPDYLAGVDMYAMKKRLT
jgi:ribosomal protein S18 acetylase RimI-like enzyme